jgi:hypothetical protein
VNLLSLIDQIGKRSAQQRFNPGDGPGRRLGCGFRCGFVADDGLREVGHDAGGCRPGLGHTMEMVGEALIRVKFSLSHS